MVATILVRRMAGSIGATRDGLARADWTVTRAGGLRRGTARACFLVEGDSFPLDLLCCLTRRSAERYSSAAHRLAALNQTYAQLRPDPDLGAVAFGFAVFTLVVVVAARPAAAERGQERGLRVRRAADRQRPRALSDQVLSRLHDLHPARRGRGVPLSLGAHLPGAWASSASSRWCVFMVLLGGGFAYAWKVGALDW